MAKGLIKKIFGPKEMTRFLQDFKINEKSLRKDSRYKPNKILQLRLQEAVGDIGNNLKNEKGYFGMREEYGFPMYENGEMIISFRPNPTYTEVDVLASANTREQIENLRTDYQVLKPFGSMRAETVQVLHKSSRRRR